MGIARGVTMGAGEDDGDPLCCEGAREEPREGTVGMAFLLEFLART
jgi:hypothetical protein